MIKAVTFLSAAGTPENFDKLRSFFLALGFEAGKGWSEPESAGASFLAPLGNVEFHSGRAPHSTGLLIEVTNLDGAHQAAAVWMQGNSTGGRIGEIEESDWKSRLFSIEPVSGHRMTFWSWIDPVRGKAVALEGDLSAAGMRFGLVVSRWNAVITERLLEGALDALLRSGARREDLQILRVPGAWEIPMAAHGLVAARGASAVDAVIPLGCLIRGETAHYEAIYTEVARGIGQLQQESGIPHSFGVLTCESLEQALNRAGIKAGNKGFEAAIAAIEMVSLKRKLASGGGQ